MAEFCLDCLNKMNNSSLTEDDVVLSKYLCFCEECCEFKYTVGIIKENNPTLFHPLAPRRGGGASKASRKSNYTK